MRMLMLVLIAVLSTGCAGEEMKLGPEWRPLKRIAEVRAWPGDRATTLGDTVVVRSLKKWAADFPEGPERHAFLLHEQMHARQQEELGLPIFIFRYGSDPKFMWSMEAPAWAAQMTWLRTHGKDVDPAAVAAALSGYETAAGQKMIDKAAALEFARRVLQGRWP